MSVSANSEREARAEALPTQEAAGLAADIRDRRPEALATTVHAYLPQVLRTARGAGFSPSEAEEIAQETFKTFVETAPRFEGRSRVRTWIFGILFRKMSEARRAFARQEASDPIDEVFESRFDDNGGWIRPPRRPDADLEAREMGALLEGCLQEAPERQRIAFVLREIEGLETAEICKILDVTATNLGVMMHRVRNRLRECLETKGVRP